MLLDTWGSKWGAEPDLDIGRWRLMVAPLDAVHDAGRQGVRSGGESGVGLATVLARVGAGGPAVLQGLDDAVLHGRGDVAVDAAYAG